MRHRFHALCPYFAMFPELFVEKHLVYSKPGDLVFDPFSGRGTTAFQSLLSGRRAIASDISPVAYCVSNAKASAPRRENLLNRIEELRENFVIIENDVCFDPFFQLCFNTDTLNQLLYLRQTLNWREDEVDCFIAALVLGQLHGESHRSPRYFSNRMPRTIATKPNYSVNWWKRYGYTPPKRDVFNMLKLEVAYRYESPIPEGKGVVKQGDARKSAKLLKDYTGDVRLIITSPPYPDTTHFAEDQWLRGWFLGGAPTPTGIKRGDDRHTSLESYWKFLKQSWAGLKPLLSNERATVVVRIGGSKLNIESAKAGLLEGLETGLDRDIHVKSALETKIVGGQLRSFRPRAAGTKREFDFVFQLEPITH